MNNPKLDITDQKVLEVAEYLKLVGSIKSKAQLWEIIGIHKQSVQNIKLGKQRFTAAHIQSLVSSFGINANYIMGVESNILLNRSKTKNPSKALPERV